MDIDNPGERGLQKIPVAVGECRTETIRDEVRERRERTDGVNRGNRKSGGSGTSSLLAEQGGLSKEGGRG